MSSCIRNRETRHCSFFSSCHPLQFLAMWLPPPLWWFFGAFCKPLKTSESEHRSIWGIFFLGFFFCHLEFKQSLKMSLKYCSGQKPTSSRTGRILERVLRLPFCVGKNLLKWLILWDWIFTNDGYWVGPEAGLLWNRQGIRTVLSLSMEANAQEVLCC